MSLATEPPIAAAEAVRLHVIIVNDFASTTGGSSRVAIAEAIGLSKRGHRVTLVAGSGEPDPELIDAGVEVVGTGQHTTLDDPVRVRAAVQGVWNRAAAALVRNVIARADPASTVVHLHGFIKVLSPSVVRAAVGSGLPVIATLHDYSVGCPNGGLFNYQTNEVCELTPMSARCVTTHCDARAYSHKLWRVGRQAVQRGAGAIPRGVNQFIVPSGRAAELMRPFLPSGTPVHVLSNPILLDRQPPAAVARNAPFVLVGRLQRDKGGAIFAQAARDAGVRAVIVGDGDQASAIRRVNPDAELTGWIDHQQVRATTRSARALVNASLWYENQPVTLLEAAADGVPAIVSDVIVARDTVPDQVSGLWFRAGDVDDLADKLAALDRDPGLAGRLGAAAYERFWSDPPTLDKHLDALQDVYHSGLAGPVRARR